MVKLDAHLLTAIAPHNSGERGVRQSKIIASVGAILADTLAAYDMSSNLRTAHFLAQICHESDGFVSTVEYADGKAYENRIDLGNNQPGDGPRFKGRGLIQLTGRTNYRKYGDLLGLDLINHPAMAADPAVSLKLACEYWKQHTLNGFADKDDIETIARRINGELDGLKSRQAYLACAKAVLGQGAAATPATAPHPILHRGDQGERVKVLQQGLARMGYAVGSDGVFGPGTESAVMQFQATHGMIADGVVGAQTWVRLGV